MAIGKKTGGRDFEPGQSGNPAGKPRLPEEVRNFRNAAKAEVVEEFKYLWSLTEGQLNQIVDSDVEDDIPAIRKFMAKAILRAVNTGDMHHIDAILNRVIGKVKEEIDLNQNVNVHSKVVEIINRLTQPKEVDHGKTNKKAREEKSDET